MKRNFIILFIIMGLGLIISLGGNIYQQSHDRKVDQQMTQIKRRNQRLSHQLSAVNYRNKFLINQQKNDQVTQNNQGKSQSEQNFNTVVTKFFKVMTNFKPKTYGQRKAGVKNLIADKLYQQYFSNKGTDGDSNSVSAKLDQLNLYTQSKQGQNLKGLAVVSYESKSGDNDWQKATVLYQVTFDPATDRINAVQNLGNSFKASDID